MFRRTLQRLAVIGSLAWANGAVAITVTMDTGAAKAALVALNNPALSHGEAIRVAKMPGNQGTIRKLNEFKIPATTETFARALYAAAHGEKVVDPAETNFFFDVVKSKDAQLLELIKTIETNPKDFQADIEKRIAMFTPAKANISLHGYVVAAGDGGGYAFGDTDFYLNVGIIDELVVAKTVVTHELYHAVQGAYAHDRDTPNGVASNPTCAATAKLFANLYEEGSAVYVEDISLLASAHSASGLRQEADLTDGIKQVRGSAALLEMSVASLAARNPVPYDMVYGVGFYGHAILYNIAYIMAKAIVDNGGPSALTSLLKEPAYDFILQYAKLPKYGIDADHPKLGPNTIEMANELANGCK